MAEPAVYTLEPFCLFLVTYWNCRFHRAEAVRDLPISWELFPANIVSPGRHRGDGVLWLGTHGINTHLMQKGHQPTRACWATPAVIFCKPNSNLFQAVTRSGADSIILAVMDSSRILLSWCFLGLIRSSRGMRLKLCASLQASLQGTIRINTMRPHEGEGWRF